MRCERCALPMVGIDRPCSSAMATIRIDEREAAAAIARLALVGKPRRVGVVALHTGLDAGLTLARDTVPAVRDETTRRRLEGCLSVLEAAPHAPSIVLREAPLDVPDEDSDDAWGAPAAELAGLDALIAMSDDVARELVDRLPARIRVFGFDGLDETGDFATVVQPIEQKGRLAVEAIYARGGPLDRVLPTRIVERSRDVHGR